MINVCKIKLTLLSGALILAAGCAKKNDSTTVSTYAYQGAGSRWTASFSGGSFTLMKYSSATATTETMTVSGTYVDYSSAFRQLTVTSSSGTGAPAAGTTAYGLEIPGFAFFLKPVDSANAEPIVMVNSGSCPTSNFQGNWIAADFESGANTNDSQDAFGSASFTINGASSSAVIGRRSFLTGTAMTNSSLPFNSANCSGGVLDAGGGVSMYLTTSGGALVSTTASKIFAAPAHTADFTQAAAAGTYSGIAFVADASSKQIPMKLTLPASGNATASEITNVTTDATGSGAVTFSSFAGVASTNGLFRATAVNGSDTGAVNCAYFVYNGTNVIGCNGYFRNDTGDVDGDSNTTEKAPFFFLARSR